MKTFAIARRILQQLRRDRRTLMLLLAAPLLLLTLIYWLFGAYGTNQAVALVTGPVQYQKNLEENEVQVIRCSQEEGLRLLETGTVTAVVQLYNDRLHVELDGSSNSAQQVLAKLQQAQQFKSGWYGKDRYPEVNYYYGYEGLSMFDQFGSILIGILVFFLVFLISGISFVQERTSGTLEKLLSTPIKRWEIVLGYLLGFGVITLLQSVLLVLYVVYVLQIMQAGSIWLILFITLLSAITALTLGILLSTVANSEFQMMQFIPVIIVPQIFLSGIFDLQGIWQTLSYATPIHYIANGLRLVMLKGAGLSAVLPDIICLIGFSVLFFIINVQLLKKQRRV